MRGSGATKDEKAAYYAVENERVPWASSGPYNGPPVRDVRGVSQAAPCGQRRLNTFHNREENAAYGAGAGQYGGFGEAEYADERDIPFGQPHNMPMDPLGSRSRRLLQPQPPTIEFDPIPGCPPGLEALVGQGVFDVREHIDAFEFFTGFEMANRYSVFSPLGRIYFAGEVSTFCNRYWCSEAREFVLNIFGPSGRLLFYMERPCSASVYCCGSRYSGSDMAIYLADSTELLGGINQRYSCDAPNFTITDPSGRAVLTIEGPSCGACCPCALVADISFNIYDMNRNPVGMIMKRFTLKEIVSDANDFGLLIPPELDPRLKAVLLGAVFSIERAQDYSIFESEAGTGRGKNASKDCDYCPCCRGACFMIWLVLYGCILPVGILLIIFRVQGRI